MPLRFRAVLWRTRWLVAALCLGCAAWIVVGELRPPPPVTTAVVVAAHELSAGTVLTAADLREVRMTEPPDQTVPLADAIGTPLTISLPAGTPLVSSMLLGPGLADSAPPGWVVVPAPLADPVLARLLRVGDRVDLYLAPSDTGGRVDEAMLVAAEALVLARGNETAESTSLLGVPAGPEDVVIVVAIPAADAAAITGASGFGPFRAVLSAT